jgi:hypothetical protein
MNPGIRRMSMPEKCRVGVCGFDPMLVRGYVKTGFRALWWHLSDEVYEQYKVKPGDTVKGKLLAVYNGDGGKKTASPNEPFEWKCSKESGLAVLLPPGTIIKYELTECHFLELRVEKINDQEVYPGKEQMSAKWWPEEKMKLGFVLKYIAP